MKYLIVLLLFTSCLAGRHTAVPATIISKKAMFNRSGWVLYEYITPDGTHLEFLSKKNYAVGKKHGVLPCYAKRIWK